VEISKAIILEIQPFKTFDNIMKVLLENDRIIALICLGTKKINSKNSRSMNEGNVVQIEYFKSLNENKISKLKKTNLIEQFP
jgi:recombinational DNA repair protein (RecF pathway)